MKHYKILHSKMYVRINKKKHWIPPETMSLLGIPLIGITIQERKHQQNQFGTARHILILFSLMQKSI